MKLKQCLMVGVLALISLSPMATAQDEETEKAIERYRQMLR